MNETIQKIFATVLAAAIIGIYAHAFVRVPDKYASKGMVHGMNDSLVKRVSALEKLATDVHRACATLEAMDKRLERIEDKLP